MSFSIGIVGLPNVGKSTLFNLLTQNQVEASNYPFCTIDPHVGCVRVPDKRVDQLSNISQSKKTIHTMIEFVDIAGLVEGAHKGEGLGNKFLANIREVDAICHVVRQFSDSNITHVSGEINPKNDKSIIELELIMADLQTATKRIDTLKKQNKGKVEKEVTEQINLLTKVISHLEEEKMINSLELTPDEQKSIKQLHLLTTKPIMYVLNVDEQDLNKSETPFISENEKIIKINAKLEAELMELSEEEQKEYLKELNIDESGLDKMIKTAYDLLGLITFFTTGEQETRAWTIPKGSTAPQAAGCIHTDFEKGFIRAETISYNDFIEYGGENAAKEKGAMRLEGKDYIMQDGDTCHFRFST